MPITQRGRFAKNSSTLPRASFFFSTALPRSSAPCTWNDLLAISRPMVVACIWASPLRGSLRFHAGRSMPSAGGVYPTIKECQADLFADRTSAATMQANQLRLWFASMAYVLLCALRRIGLKHTQFAQATCDTIRLKLVKIGALVRISVRRVKVAIATAFPNQHEFKLAHALLSHAA